METGKGYKRNCKDVIGTEIAFKEMGEKVQNQASS